MANGVLVPNIEYNETTQSGVILRKSGQMYYIGCNGLTLNDNGTIGTGIPSGYRPKELQVVSCLISRTSSPTHVIGYATIDTNGIMMAVEPYNGGYRYPTGAQIFFDFTWIQN